MMGVVVPVVALERALELELEPPLLSEALAGPAYRLHL